MNLAGIETDVGWGQACIKRPFWPCPVRRRVTVRKRDRHGADVSPCQKPPVESLVAPWRVSLGAPTVARGKGVDRFTVPYCRRNTTTTTTRLDTLGKPDSHAQEAKLTFGLGRLPCTRAVRRPGQESCASFVAERQAYRPLAKHSKGRLRLD